MKNIDKLKTEARLGRGKRSVWSALLGLAFLGDDVDVKDAANISNKIVSSFFKLSFSFRIFHSFEIGMCGMNPIQKSHLHFIRLWEVLQFIYHVAVGSTVQANTNGRYFVIL